MFEFWTCGFLLILLFVCVISFQFVEIVLMKLNVECIRCESFGSSVVYWLKNLACMFVVNLVSITLLDES